jgi:hypothetical protein
MSISQPPEAEYVRLCKSMCMPYIACQGGKVIRHINILIGPFAISRRFQTIDGRTFKNRSPSIIHRSGLCNQPDRPRYRSDKLFPIFKRLHVPLRIESSSEARLCDSIRGMYKRLICMRAPQTPLFSNPHIRRSSWNVSRTCTYIYTLDFTPLLLLYFPSCLSFELRFFHCRSRGRVTALSRARD